jgi:MoaA/NifB/PqqE/SkfB family radical SAM enzyme
MFFSVDGRILPCCQNRNHSYGDIKNQTISEIWNGKKIIELRNHIDNSTLPDSCSECSKRIIDGNFDAVKARHYDEISINKKHPTMMEFELSNNCNLQCIMCSSKFSSSFHSDNKESKREKDIYSDEFLEQLDEFIPHLEKVEFLGGEPFFISVYYKIWERIIQLNPGCVIMVQTNGTILNDKIKLLLLKGNFRINVSIDSFQKDTYQKIRKNSNFENVIENISFFANYAEKNKYPLGISVCPMQQNWEEIPEIIKKCNELNAFVHFNTVFSPDTCSLYSLPFDKLITAFNKLSASTFPNKTRIEKKNKFHFDGFLNQLSAWIEEKKELNEKLKIKALWWRQKQDEIEKYTVAEHLDSVLKYLKISLHNNSENNYDEKDLQLFSEKLNCIIVALNGSPYMKHFLFKLKEYPTELVIKFLSNNNKDFIINKAKSIQKDIVAEIEYC